MMRMLWGCRLRDSCVGRQHIAISVLLERPMSPTTCLALQVWMRAIVSDGPDGRVYATARALFVAPKPQRLIHDGIRLVVPAWPFGK
jgi:hypothetical protein